MKYWDTLGKSVISTRTFEIVADANTAEFAQEIVRGLESAAQLATAAQRERELREALEPFAQPELYRQLGGNIEGDDSIIFVRDDAELRLGDFRRAARLLASADGMQGEGGGEG